MHRRYTDFETLYDELVDQRLEQFIPPIPEKSVEDRWSNDDSKFVLTRIKQLEHFLNSLVEDEILSQMQIFHKFLTMHERQYELQ